MNWVITGGCSFIDISLIKTLIKESNHNSYQGLLEIGVDFHYLTKKTMKEMFGVVAEFKGQIRKNSIYKGVK